MSETSARPHVLAGVRLWLVRPRKSSPTLGLLVGLVLLLLLGAVLVVV